MGAVVRAGAEMNDRDLDKIAPTRLYLTRLQQRIKKNKMLEDTVGWKHETDNGLIHGCNEVNVCFKLL